MEELISRFEEASRSREDCVKKINEIHDRLFAEADIISEARKEYLERRLQSLMADRDEFSKEKERAHQAIEKEKEAIEKEKQRHHELRLYGKNFRTWIIIILQFLFVAGHFLQVVFIVDENSPRIDEEFETYSYKPIFNNEFFPGKRYQSFDKGFEPTSSDDEFIDRRKTKASERPVKQKHSTPLLVAITGSIGAILSVIAYWNSDWKLSRTAFQRE